MWVIDEIPSRRDSNMALEVTLASSCTSAERYPPGGNMNVVRTGVILNTVNYEACVSFYRNLFGLKVLFQDSNTAFRMTCFEYGGSYLMVETDGVATPGGKTKKENTTKLRFNVSDINEALETV